MGRSGGIVTREHDLASTRDPREALARNAARLRERERWAAEGATESELGVIAAARARLAALAAAIENMDDPGEGESAEA